MPSDTCLLDPLPVLISARHANNKGTQMVQRQYNEGTKKVQNKKGTHRTAISLCIKQLMSSPCLHDAPIINEQTCTKEVTLRIIYFKGKKTSSEANKNRFLFPFKLNGI